MIAVILKNSLLGFLRNPLRSIGAIIIIGLVIFFAGILATINKNSDDFLNNTRQNLSFEIYLQDDATRAELLHLKTFVKSLHGYRSHKYHKSDDTYKQMQQTVGNSLLPDNGFNPFPNMIVISFYPEEINLNTFQSSENELKKIRAVKDVNYGKEWFTEQEPILAGFNKFTNYFALCTFLTALIVIFWAVHGIATANKVEIYLLDLFGSSWKYLALPYMIQGVLLSILGASFGLVLLYFVWYYFLTSPIKLQFISNVSILTIIVSALIAGLFSATIATRNKQ